jgi:hypothetical protein
MRVRGQCRRICVTRRSISSTVPALASMFDRRSLTRPVPAGRQQVPAAEDVERQIAVTVIIAMEEAALLMPVQRVVQLEDDLLRRLRMRLDEQVDEKPLDRLRVMPDLMIAGRPRRWRGLQPVQGALDAARPLRAAGQGRAVRSPRRQLPRQDRIVSELVVIVQVFVPQRQPEHPLTHQRLDPVLKMLGRAVVPETAGEARHQTERPVGRTEQQRTRIRGDHPAIERRHHRTPFDACKTEQVRATLRLHRGISLNRLKLLRHNNFRPFRAPMHLLSVKYPG